MGRCVFRCLFRLALFFQPSWTHMSFHPHLVGSKHICPQAASALSSHLTAQWVFLAVNLVRLINGLTLVIGKLTFAWGASGYCYLLEHIHLFCLVFTRQTIMRPTFLLTVCVWIHAGDRLEALQSFSGLSVPSFSSSLSLPRASGQPNQFTWSSQREAERNREETQESGSCKFRLICMCHRHSIQGVSQTHYVFIQNYLSPLRRSGNL